MRKDTDRILRVVSFKMELGDVNKGQVKRLFHFLRGYYTITMKKEERPAAEGIGGGFVIIGIRE